MTPVQKKSGRRLTIKRSVESVTVVNVTPAKRKRVTLTEYRQLDARLSSAKTTIALIHTKLSQKEDDYNRLNALLEQELQTMECEHKDKAKIDYDEEIVRLTQQVYDLQSSAGNSSKEKAMSDEIVALQAKLQEVCDENMALERTLETATKMPSRTRAQACVDTSALC